MKNKSAFVLALLFAASFQTHAADFKQAPAVIEATKIIEQRGCKPWLGVMKSAKLVFKNHTDDNAFVVPMFCDGKPQALLAAQKSGKTYVSKETFKVVLVVKFDGKFISGMATQNGQDKSTPYKIEAFK